MKIKLLSGFCWAPSTDVWRIKSLTCRNCLIKTPRESNPYCVFTFFFLSNRSPRLSIDSDDFDPVEVSVPALHDSAHGPDSHGGHHGTKSRRYTHNFLVLIY
jgi:hypothetical protein